MVSFSQMRKATLLRPGVHLAPIAAVLLLIASCVDLTTPWDRPDAKLPLGGAGAGGNSLTTSVTGGASGGTSESSSVSTGGSSEPIDAPVGGTSHPGSSSAGSSGKDGGVDHPGTGGTGGEPDAGPDAPQSGTGGTGGKQDASVVGGSSTTGGAVAGNTGGSVTGGATGGTSKSGGAGGSSSTLPDGGGDTADASPLLTGLVVYYRFETANGTVVQDSSGNGHDGTLSIGQPLDGGTAPTGTAYEYVTGKVGKALALHKAGLGYVRVPPAVFANATELTIALWVNVVAEQNWQRVLDVGITPNPYQSTNSPTGTKYFNIVPKAGGTANNMLFSISSNGFSNEQQLAAPIIPVNTWTHVTVVLASGGGARLYLNGNEAAFSAAVTLRPKDLGTIDYAFIGRSRFDADPSFEGQLDCFRIYNRALSVAEIQALYSYTVGH